MKQEQQDKIRKILEDRKEQGEFVSRCAEFLGYVEVDCAGLSPGLSFFKQSAFGLRHLASQMPQYKQLFEDAAVIYDTMAREAPGAMYPRGSQIFDDLKKIGDIESALRDAGETEWGV